MRATLVLVSVVVWGAGCACPGCPEDSVDGVQVSVLAPPSIAERGALDSAIELVAVAAGPAGPEVTALRAALDDGRLLIGWFREKSTVRGYTLLAGGRVALDHRYVRAVAADSAYLASPMVWPLLPYLYAAGFRLANGGSREASIDAARTFAVKLAGSVEAEMAASLRSWRDAP